MSNENKREYSIDKRKWIGFELNPLILSDINEKRADIISLKTLKFLQLIQLNLIFN